MEQKQQAKPVNLLDLFTDEERARVEALKYSEYEEKSGAVSKEWLRISEFGFYYGFDGVRAMLDNYIDIPTVDMLIQGARKIHSGHVYDMGLANLAAVPTKSKNHFNTIMDRYRKDMEVDA